MLTLLLVAIGVQAQVDTLPPTITIYQPLDGAIVKTQTITVSGTAFDNETGIASVTVNGKLANGTLEWTLNLILSKGSNKITVIATDNAGNNNTISITATYKPERGDFNGDGKVDFEDATLVAYMVIGKIPAYPEADFNGNGRVDIGDAAKIAFYVAGKISELDREYKVGAILPLTEYMSVDGNNVKKGIDLALDEINSKGGINGKLVKVIYKDNKGNTTETVSAMNELVNENIPVVIGAVTSSNTLAISPIAEKTHTLLISPASTSPKLSNYSNYVFRTIASDVYQGIALSRMAMDDLNYKEVAILYIDNEYGIGLRNEFVKDYNASYGKVLLEESFKEGTTDFNATLTKINNTSAKAVILISYTAEGARIVKQAKELGLNLQWICSEGVKTKEFIKQAGESAEGVIAIHPILMVAGPATDAFRASYIEKYGTEPEELSDYGYDTMYIVADAIEKGGYTSDGIRDAISDMKYYRVSGPKIFDENGDIITPAYDAWKVNNSEWVIESKFLI